MNGDSQMRTPDESRGSLVGSIIVVIILIIGAIYFVSSRSNAPANNPNPTGTTTVQTTTDLGASVVTPTQELDQMKSAADGMDSDLNSLSN